MDRRTVLAQMGAVIATGLGGCTAADDGGNASGGNETGENESLATETGTGTDSGEETESPDETTDPDDGTDTEADDETATESGDDSTEPTDDESEASSGSDNEMGDASLTVVGSECGQQRDEATVAFADGDGEVVVTGTIWGSDSCKVAELVDSQYDDGADELSVTIGTTEPESDGMEACAQCITEIEYRVTAAFDGDLPDSVTVAHDHGDGAETVATASQS